MGKIGDLGEKRAVLPANRGLFHGGRWHGAVAGGTMAVTSPADGLSLGEVAVAGREDVDAAVAAANAAFPGWAGLAPLDRAGRVRALARRILEHGDELAMLDALDCGNPLKGMLYDVRMGTAIMDYFCGLATEIRGATMPMPSGQLNYTLREPLGTVVRIVAFNHPLLFAVSKMAAPLIAGNTVIWPNWPRTSCRRAC